MKLRKLHWKVLDLDQPNTIWKHLPKIEVPRATFVELFSNKIGYQVKQVINYKHCIYSVFSAISDYEYVQIFMLLYISIKTQQ